MLRLICVIIQMLWFVNFLMLEVSDDFQNICGGDAFDAFLVFLKLLLVFSSNSATMGNLPL